mgnify:CR=1 FL=1
MCITTMSSGSKNKMKSTLSPTADIYHHDYCACYHSRLSLDLEDHRLTTIDRLTPVFLFSVLITLLCKSLPGLYTMPKSMNSSAFGTSMQTLRFTSMITLIYSKVIFSSFLGLRCAGLHLALSPEVTAG